MSCTADSRCVKASQCIHAKPALAIGAATLYQPHCPNNGAVHIEATEWLRVPLTDWIDSPVFHGQHALLPSSRVMLGIGGGPYLNLTGGFGFVTAGEFDFFWLFVRGGTVFDFVAKGIAPFGAAGLRFDLPI
jgi:hypothetical protein